LNIAACETILARLSRILDPFVAANGLGMVYRPRAVVQFEGSEVEPDLMVRQPGPSKTPWADLPTPILVVEVLSRTTRRRDRQQKRQLYLDAGVAEYWIVDGESRAVRVVRPGLSDTDVTDSLTWTPSGAAGSLRITMDDIFGV
jgi:Uma2 family endonuclease